MIFIFLDFFLDFFHKCFHIFPVVLTPADIFYHSCFPRYRQVTVFVTRRGEEDMQEELGILVVGFLVFQCWTEVIYMFIGSHDTK